MAGSQGAASAKPAAVVSREVLERFATEVFERAGLTSEHAQIVAQVLVWANLRGVDTHGVARIPRYVELIEAGDMNARPVIKVSAETSASVLIDADRAPGPVAMTTATSAAIRKAAEAGIGMALVRETTHTAALGYYTLAAAREGMAALAFSASGPNMAYHGARAAGVSTNPVSIAVPGGSTGPVLLDMATGIVSFGRLIQARRTGQALPEGCALDREGNPTTDPRRAQIPLPMAGPKGSGLSLMIECLTSLLVSNPLISECLEGTPKGRRHRQNALLIAVDLGRFGDPAAYRQEVARLVRSIKALPRDPGTAEILIPGERGQSTFERRRREGIPIPRATFGELTAVAALLGITMFR